MASLTKRAWLDPKWRHSLTNNVLFWLLSLAVTAAAGGALWWWTASPPRLTLSCETAGFPVQFSSGDSAIYGLELHPDWTKGDQRNPNPRPLQIAAPLPTAALRPGMINGWPTNTRMPGAGYKCVLFNGSDEAVFAVQLNLVVEFRDARALPSRSALSFTVPKAIEPKAMFTFFVADDTGWDPLVRFPEMVTAKVGDSEKTVEIPIRYSSQVNHPLELRAFDPVVRR